MDVLRTISSTQIVVILALCLTCVSCSNESNDITTPIIPIIPIIPIPPVIQKKPYEDVILKGDIVVNNAYTWNGNKWIADRKIHRLETFAVPSTAESIKFSGSFKAKFPVTIFLRDELGYTKWLARVDEGVTSDWVVNKKKEGSVSIPISVGKKYHLTFFFYNDDCRGFLCLGAKEKSVIIASDFKVSYMN